MCVPACVRRLVGEEQLDGAEDGEAAAAAVGGPVLREAREPRLRAADRKQKK